jgi:hypothetical protein
LLSNDQKYFRNLSIKPALPPPYKAKGAKNLGFSSSHSLKTGEKHISFAQLVLLSLHIFEGSVFTFQFLNDEIHNYVFLT